MTTLYPEIDPYEAGRLPVGDGHELAWERSGARGAPAVVFLHGGPGSGGAAKHRRYYDPAAWDIIQFDQRGCGASTPVLELETNTTQALIADIEALRTHLRVERWAVFGPSWGSTLALAYAQAHPDRVAALVVEGVFLGTRAELDWLHARAGAGAIFPDALDRLLDGVPEAIAEDPPAFRAWAPEAMREEIAQGRAALSALRDGANPDALQNSLLYRWSAYEERLSHLEIGEETVRREFVAKGPDWVTAHSLIEAWYFANDCFLRPDQLIRDADRLTMPVRIIQSRFDLICPAQGAWRLAEAVPHARLSPLVHSGHAMTAPAHTEVIAAFKELRALVPDAA